MDTDAHGFFDTNVGNEISKVGRAVLCTPLLLTHAFWFTTTARTE